MFELTRGEHDLDLFLVTSCTVVGGLGDHDMVMINSSICVQIVRPVKHKANLHKFMADAKLFSSEFINKFSVSSPAEEMWSLFKTTVIELQDQNVPSKTAATQHHQPWMTTRVKRMSRWKKRAFTRMKPSGKAIGRQTYRQVQKISASCCRETHDSHLNRLFDLSEDINKKRFWSFVTSK